MVFSRRKPLFRTLLLFSFLIAWIQLGAMRPLEGEQRVAKHELVVQSLPRGPVKESGHNPCTNIPGRETGVCKLGGMNIAGNVMHSSTTFSSLVP
ncbi:hypothetical protein V6N12_022806 [Hibiscus sabdariffa]|uniref:Uncharacterized protein n=1 Tax=Hibiscus sabdariffa TaxID=183260 RepID=A0ABR2FVR6_9ROSI